MSVTGYKAESSLKTYSGRTDEKTNKIMSVKISEKKRKKPLQPLDDNEQADFSFVPLTDSQENCLLYDLNDMDGVDDILRSIDANENVFKQTVNHNSVQANAMLPAAPVLRNCSNVIINCNITCSGIPIIN